MRDTGRDGANSYSFFFRDPSRPRSLFHHVPEGKKPNMAAAAKTIDSFPRIQLGRKTASVGVEPVLLFPPDILPIFAPCFLDALGVAHADAMNLQDISAPSRIRYHLAYLCHLEPFLAAPMYSTRPLPPFPSPFAYMYCDDEEKQHASPPAEFAITLLALTALLLEKQLHDAAFACFDLGLEKMTRVKKDAFLNEHLDHAGITGGLAYLHALRDWLRVEAATASAVTATGTGYLTQLDRIELWKKEYARLEQEFKATNDPELVKTCHARGGEMDARKRFLVMQMARKSMLAEGLTQDARHSVMRNYYQLHALESDVTKQKVAIELYEVSEKSLNLVDAKPVSGTLASVEDAIQIELQRPQWQRAGSSPPNLALPPNASFTMEWLSEMDRFTKQFPQPIVAASIPSTNPRMRANPDLVRALIVLGRLQAPDALADKDTLASFRAIAVAAGISADALIAPEMPFRASPFFPSIPTSKFVEGPPPSSSPGEVLKNAAGWLKTKFTPAPAVPEVIVPKKDTFLAWFSGDHRLNFEGWQKSGLVPESFDGWFSSTTNKSILVEALTAYSPIQWASIGLTKPHLDALGVDSSKYFGPPTTAGAWTQAEMVKAFGYAPHRPLVVPKPKDPTGIRTINYVKK